MPSSTEIKWLLIGMLALFLLQKFTGILAPKGSKGN